MQCFEILGISESATELEIDNAFEYKMEMLHQSQDVLSPNAFSKKYTELNNAKDSCKNWKAKSCPEKVRIRLHEEATTKRKTDVRLNGVCFGPCTCTDMCCGELCRECNLAGHDEGCCESMFGSQICPVICDGAMWLVILVEICIYIFPPIFEAIAVGVRSRNEAKANRIRETIAGLNSQLGEQVQRRAALEQNLEEDIQKLELMEKFAVFFDHMGANEATSVTSDQNRKVTEVRNHIYECHDRESELQTEIEANKRLLKKDG